MRKARRTFWLTIFTVVATLLLTGADYTGWRLLSGILMGSGTLLILTSMSPGERVAIFPGVLFFGTALLQQFFGAYSFHWIGDLVVGYFLLAGIATLAYYLIEPNSVKYLIFGTGLSFAAGFVWVAKRYVWPWYLISEATWLIPLLIVVIGLYITLRVRNDDNLWKKYLVR